MPQSTNDPAVVGVDLKTELNSSLIALHTSSSLSISPDLRDIIVKADGNGDPTDWARRLKGIQEWTAEHEGPLAPDGSDPKPQVADPNMSLTLDFEVDLTDDSTDNPTTESLDIPNLDSVDFNLTQEIAETGGLGDPLWRYIRPDTRDYEISLSGSYTEPTQSALYNEVRKARDAGDTVPFTLTVLGLEFSGKVMIGDTNISAETGGEDATIDLTLSANDDLSMTLPSEATDFAPSIKPAFDAFMNKNSVDVGMLHYGDSGSPETGTQKMTGSGYYSDLSISMSRGEEITCSGTIEGDGALSYGIV